MGFLCFEKGDNIHRNKSKYFEKSEKAEGEKILKRDWLFFGKTNRECS